MNWIGHVVYATPDRIMYMSNVGPGSEDLDAELESQLTEKEVKNLLTDEEYRQYQEDASLLDLLSGEEIQTLIQRYDIQSRIDVQSTENTAGSTESDTTSEDS